MILITGGSGFIGSAVVRHIIRNTTDSVLNIDKLTYAGNMDSVATVADNKRYHFVQADICNASKMSDIINKYQPSAIMHLAAESHVDRSIDGPAEFIQTNIIGTFTLLEAARAYWESLSKDKKVSFRFHHISTDEVYGDLKDTTDLFTETTAYEPSSPYSASKASSDHLVRSWNRTYGLPIIITNCSNNYGPYHFPEKLIPHVILNALTGKSLPVYGDGNQVRDWLYVDDHAKALYKVATKGAIGETYNIGGHNEKKNIEVVEALCCILDELRPISQNPAFTTTSLTNYNQLISFVKDRPGHDIRYAIDASKIDRELNWKPEESFETGIRKTVEWYLNNESWWNRVLSGEYQLERIGDK